MQASSIEFRIVLKDLNYPVTKKRLLMQAQKHGATSEVIRALNEIPDKEYTCPSEVALEFKGKIWIWG